MFNKLLIVTAMVTSNLLIAADLKQELNMKSILFWDNDGTVMGSKDPNDKTGCSKTIFPGVKDVMKNADFNFIISGFKSKESEAQNFDPNIIIAKFIEIMKILPVNAAVFSPEIGGVACYIVIKKNHEFIIKKAHEDIRYKTHIGHFKKPDIGMFIVMSDIASEEFGITITQENSLMIGDTWHDEAAANKFGITFLDAKIVHTKQSL